MCIWGREGESLCKPSNNLGSGWLERWLELLINRKARKKVFWGWTEESTDTGGIGKKTVEETISDAG